MSVHRVGMDTMYTHADGKVYVQVRIGSQGSYRTAWVLESETYTD